MASFNRIILIGNVGRDPDVRNSSGGMTIANFSLATTERRKGEEATSWHRCVAFDKTAGVVSQFVTKGSSVCVEGRLTYEEWEDKEGVSRIMAKIVVSSLQLLGAPRGERQVAKEPDRKPASNEVGDDDIPF